MVGARSCGEPGATSPERALAVTSYGYYAEDQIIQITKPDASVITYKYDAFGRRVQKDVAGVIIRYVYDGDDIRLEYSTSTSPLARYSYGDGVDEPLSAERGGARYFYHANHLGSIRHLTDASGASTSPSSPHPQTDPPPPRAAPPRTR